MLERRKFLKAMLGVVAAPVIVRASSLMHIKALAPSLDDFTTDNLIVTATERYAFMYSDWKGFWGSVPPQWPDVFAAGDGYAVGDTITLVKG